jgi:hypothetical protein
MSLTCDHLQGREDGSGGSESRTHVDDNDDDDDLELNISLERCDDMMLLPREKRFTRECL